MVKEYKIAKGWAVFIYVAAPILIIAFSIFLIMPFLPEAQAFPPIFYFVMMPVSLGMIAVSVIGLIDTNKARFIIDMDKVYAIGTFYNRELSVNEIKGYRIDNNAIFIEPGVKGKRRIRLSNYFANVAEISHWLAERFPDLDAMDAVQDFREIVINNEYGWTPEERAEKLSNARTTARLLTIIGTVVGMWTLFIADPYEYCMLLCIAIPIIAIFAHKVSQGLIRVNETKNGYPTIFWAVLISPAALCLRSLMDFNIFSYANVWATTIPIALVLIAVLLFGNREFRFSNLSDILTMTALSIFLYAYSFGAIISLNCQYDQSHPEPFGANVISKRIKAGKTDTYFLELTPWGPRTEVEEVTVTRELYDMVDNDDQVTIYLQEGLFQIPWFEISQ